MNNHSPKYINGSILATIFPFQSRKRMFVFFTLLTILIVIFLSSHNDVARVGSVALLISGIGAMKQTEKAEMSIDNSDIPEIINILNSTDWTKCNNYWINGHAVRYFEDLSLRIFRKKDIFIVVGPMETLRYLVKKFDDAADRGMSHPK